MNFLGHIFLTPDNDELLFGNFIADSVKGNPLKHYSGLVAEGIRFHRAIDEFTDNHPLVKQGVNRFRSDQGRFAPVVIDVVYDHILASDWKQYHVEDLKSFVDTTYQRLESQSHEFPKRVEHFFPFMKSQNWLYNYQFEWGLKKSLEGLDRRTSIETEMVKSVDVFKHNEREFREEFAAFLEDARRMANDYFSG